MVTPLLLCSLLAFELLPPAYESCDVKWRNSTGCYLRKHESPIPTKKRSQLFIRSHNETLSIAAMCVRNPDGSPVGIPRLKPSPNSNRLY